MSFALSIAILKHRILRILDKHKTFATKLYWNKCNSTSKYYEFKRVPVDTRFANKPRKISNNECLLQHAIKTCAVLNEKTKTNGTWVFFLLLGSHCGLD